MISDWIINPTWILLDKFSSASVCCNADLVTNISECKDDEILTMETNGGEQKYEHTATLKILPIDVHFKSDSLANIIASCDVVTMPGVSGTMDSSRKKALTVKTANEHKFKFVEYPDGLYHYDTNKDGGNSKNKSEICSYSFI